MKNEPCPPQNELSAFVRCQVSEEQAEAISEHVANCSQCEETVVGLEKRADTVFDRLKCIPASFPFQDEPELERMARAAKQRPAEKTSNKSDSPPPVPMLERLRDYRVVEKIGEGGMGAVYRAIHTRLNKTVALKVLSSSRLKDESAISRFQREMSIVGRLQHPNIVQAHDAGEEDGQHFLVMEYVEGSDLAEIVRRRGPLSVSAACEVIAQTATGLQYAYENGLVHRDIKPSNLMLAVSSERRTNEDAVAIVKILDLGLARLHTDDKENGPELTTNGQIMGTLDYMAPEQGGDSHAVDIRADIYSMGATLYKLLTGETLFSGERHRSIMQKLTALATEPAPSVRERRPEVPEPLAAIIARMLSKQPEARFSTPAEVVNALQPFRTGGELSALLGMSSQPSDAVPPSPTVQLASHDPPPKTRHPFAAAAKWFFGAAALFAIILTITTKQGTIEVESPDGKLPDDLKVVASRGGERVDVLQADNQWRASVAGGKIQLELQGGADRFELTESTLTVNRFGKSIVKLQLKPAAAAPVVAANDKAQSKPAATNANPDKQFVVVGEGAHTGEFNSLYGALSAVSGDDVVEVHSNGPVLLTTPEAITKPLHIRAGKGYRPVLVLKGWTLMHEALLIEDCDLDLRAGNWHANAPVSSPWEFRRCRCWGGIVGHVSVPRLTLTDCIFDTMSGFNLAGLTPTEVVVTNCAIRCWQQFLGFVDGAAPVTVRLNGNTCRFHGGGSLVRLDPLVKSAIKFEVTGNVFEFRARHPYLMLADKLETRVDWLGRDNLYCGKWRVELPDGTIDDEGLTAWNKRWKQPEVNSRELAIIAFSGSRTGDWTSLERIAVIRTTVERIKTESQLEHLGPDWSLVGVGDNYLRAMSAEGKAVPKELLRPEPHTDGPIVIIREKSEFKGFLTLAAALEAAESGDVIEIRTDDPIPGVAAEGKSRRLTLCAAPGYSPIINGDCFLAQDRLIVEGLTFRSSLSTSGNIPWSWRGEGPPFPGNGCIERLANCVFLSPDVLQHWGWTNVFHTWGWFRGDEDQVPEITNCVLGTVAAGIPAGRKLHIKNSVLATAWISVDGNEEPGHLEISDSLLWTPDPGTVPDVGSIIMRSPLTIASRNSVFLSPGDIVGIDDIVADFRGWTGTRNAYMKAGKFVDNVRDGSGAIASLDELMKTRTTDFDSIELLPFSFDPENWRVWRERTVGYEPRGEGTDFGADIDRLRNAFVVDSAAVK